MAKPSDVNLKITFDSQEENNNPWMDATKYFPENGTLVEGMTVKEFKSVIFGTMSKTTEISDVFFHRDKFHRPITHWRYKVQDEELGKINKPVEPHKKELKETKDWVDYKDYIPIENLPLEVKILRQMNQYTGECFIVPGVYKDNNLDYLIKSSSLAALDGILFTEKYNKIFWKYKELTTLEKLEELSKFAKGLFYVTINSNGQAQMQYQLPQENIFEDIKYSYSRTYDRIEECINKEYERLIK